MPGDTCVTSHPDFDAILNKVTLNRKCNFCILQFLYKTICYLFNVSSIGCPYNQSKNRME